MVNEKSRRCCFHAPSLSGVQLLARLCQREWWLRQRSAFCAAEHASQKGSALCVWVCVFIGSLIKLCRFQQYKKWRISKYKKHAKTKWLLWLFIMCHAHCILRDQSFETYKCMKEKFSWCIVFKLTSRDSSRCLYIVTWNDPLKCRKRHSLPQLKVRQFTFNVRAISTIAFCFLVCLGSLDKKNLINVQNNIISGASQNKSPTLISVNSNHIKNLIERNATLVWCALSLMK